MAYRLNSPCGCCGGFAADYLLYTYYWDVGSGTDLDTRTNMVVPRVGTILGWCRGNDNPYMFWGGDNQGTSGFEACYADVAKTKLDFPSATKIDVVMRAMWFSSALSGFLTVTITAYLGGTMSHVGYTFVNVGGTQTALLTFNTGTLFQSQTCGNDGATLGTASYDLTTGILTFV